MSTSKISLNSDEILSFVKDNEGLLSETNINNNELLKTLNIELPDYSEVKFSKTPGTKSGSAQKAASKSHHAFTRH